MRSCIKTDLSQIYDPAYLAHLADLAESRYSKVQRHLATKRSENSAKDKIEEADLPETLQKAKVLSVLALLVWSCVIDFVPKGAGLLKFAAVKSPVELYGLLHLIKIATLRAMFCFGTKSSELILKPWVI